MKKSHLIAALWIMGCYTSVASAITGGEIVERVQKKLNDYKSFSAAFEKQFYWAALDRSRSREGHLYMRRPGYFRVELDNGDAMVADGQTVWSYVERNRQVVVSSYDGELRTPWQIFVDYSDNYIPLAVEETKLSGRSSYVLILGPANQSEVRSRKQMKVWVDKKKWWLIQIETVEDNGDITTYTLKNHKENKKIKDDVFAFEVLEGIDVIDRRVPVFDDE
jgi:chaperone LolA